MEPAFVCGGLVRRAHSEHNHCDGMSSATHAALYAGRQPYGVRRPQLGRPDRPETEACQTGGEGG